MQVLLLLLLLQLHLPPLSSERSERVCGCEGGLGVNAGLRNRVGIMVRSYIAVRIHMATSTSDISLGMMPMRCFVYTWVPHHVPDDAGNDRCLEPGNPRQMQSTQQSRCWLATVFCTAVACKLPTCSTFGDYFHEI